MLNLLNPVEGTYVLTVLISIISSLIALDPAAMFSILTQMKEVESILLKIPLEAFSYAYYLELNDSFNPTLYSDEANEVWNVPNYFSYPSGGTLASCESVDGKLGCTIWNLTNTTNPCPDVANYSPNPAPDVTVASSGIENRFQNVYSTLTGKVNALLPHINTTTVLSSLNITPSATGYRMNLSYQFSIKSDILSYKDTVNTSADISVSTNNATSTARCVCDTPSGTQTLATYTVNNVVVNVRGSIDGVRLLDESTVYIRYFDSLISSSTASSYSNCRIVFG